MTFANLTGITDNDYGSGTSDFNLVLGDASSAPEAGDAYTTSSVGVAPSPFTTTTRIEYSIPSGMIAVPAVVEIFDASGRRVREFESAPSGQGSVHWDGRDGRGVPVPSGVYLVRVSSGAMGSPEEWPTARVTLLR